MGIRFDPISLWLRVSRAEISLINIIKPFFFKKKKSERKKKEHAAKKPYARTYIHTYIHTYILRAVRPAVVRRRGNGKGVWRQGG